MKIGIITDSGTNNYHTGYPHLREVQIWMKALINEGHELFLLSHPLGKAAWKKYTDKRELFHEWFQDRIGVKAIPEDENDITIDKLIVVGYPWISRWNFGGVDILKKYSKKVDSITWVVVDYEMYSPNKSLLYDIIPNQHKDIYEKINVVFTTDPLLKSKIDKPHVYLPHLYDSDYEIKISPKSQRNLLCKFVGPIGGRKSIIDILDSLNLISLECGLKTEFWGEGYAKKYRASLIDLTEQKEKYLGFEIKEDRVFLPQLEFIKFCSNSIVSLHDSYFEKWLSGKCTKALWHSGKMTDAAYAGVYQFSSPWEGGDSIVCGSLDKDKFKSSLENVLRLSDSDYNELVLQFRKSMNDTYGIDKWYPILKENLLK